MEHRVFSARVTFTSITLFAALLGHGQEFRATITGRVTDAQKAAIPDARVVATLMATGAKSETQTGSDGLYAIPFLSPGSYRVEAEANGFKRSVRTSLDVAAGERMGLDIELTIGAVTESVNVTAEAPLLETTTATAGEVIGSKQVENLPMNGRTPLVLAQLAFGVVPNSDPKFNRPFDNAGPSGFSMGGAPAQKNELLLDGAPDTTGDQRVGYNPPVDAVDEVRVHVFEADAAYGHTGGGTANVILKSGSNAFHGSASEFNQTSALAAQPFFVNAQGQKVPAGRYNQWGVTVGGPWILPKIFNGRNKAFWFFAWEDINDSFSEPNGTTVPTAAERNGDFSALLNAGKNYQIYDPLTGVSSGGRITRQPFPNNIIPAARLNTPSGAIAKNYLQFFPLPNQAGNADGSGNYTAINQSRKDTYNQELGRLDFNLSDKHRFSWNFRHNDRIENRSDRFKNIATGGDLLRINWGTTLDDVYTLTPTTVMNVRVNWSRFLESNVNPSNGFDAAKFGFPSYLGASSSLLELPQLTFSHSFPTIDDRSNDKTPFDIFQVFGDVVKVSGNHSLKIGADIRELRESRVSYGNSQGSFSFNDNWTRGPVDNSPTAPFGQDFAAFMLGMPTGGSYDINPFRTNQAKYLALFVNDDWRVRPNLTLNLGIRYEHEFPTYERFNRSINGFDLSTANPIAAAALAAYAKNPITVAPGAQFQVPGGPTFVGANDAAIYHTESHIFSPRFGFAWTPGGSSSKTVLRGGTGVFVFPLGTTGVNQPGFSATNPLVASKDSMLTPYSTLANPFPDGIARPTGSSLRLATNLGQGVTFYNPHVRNAYSFRWEMSVQRELPHRFVLEVAYVGNHAVHLAEGSTAKNSNDLNLNYLPAKYLSTSPTRDDATNNLLSNTLWCGKSSCPNPLSGLYSTAGTTTSLQSLLLPFPEFGTVAMTNANGGSSYFHSMDIRLEKKYSHGFNVLANFTYSKLIEKTRLLNDFDLSPEKRIAGDDRPLRFVAHALYELPIGRGKMLDFKRTWANRVLAGWVLSGIYTNQIGAPLGSWGDVIFFGGDLKNSPHQVNGTVFDVTRFDRVSANQLVSHVRTFPTRFANLRQDGANNMDLSLIKETPLTERIKLQLRFEAFNAFNRPEFNAPSLSPTNAAFGVINSSVGQNNLSRSIQIGARVSW